MASVPTQPPRTRTTRLQDRDGSFYWTELVNARVVEFNDTRYNKKSKRRNPYYAAKVPQMQLINTVDDNETGGERGSFYYLDPLKTAANRGIKVAAYGNKVFVKKGDEAFTEIFDAEGGAYLTTITKLTGFGTKRYIYFCIGTESFGNKVLKYNLADDTVTAVTLTGVSDCFVIGIFGDRMVVGQFDGLVRYSAVASDGNFTVFTPDATNPASGGILSGSAQSPLVFADVRGFLAVVEENQITFHEVPTPIGTGTGIQKDTRTIQEGITLTDYGVRNHKSVATATGKIAFIDEGNSGVFLYDIISRRTPKDLTENWKELFSKYSLKDSCIEYHPQEKAYYMCVTSFDGGSANVTLIYHEKTETWAELPERRVSSFIWDDEEKDMFGFGSIEPKYYRIISKSYDALVECKMKGVFLGRDTQYDEKEHSSTSLRVGSSESGTTFNFKLNTDLVNDAIVEEDVEIDELVVTGDAGIPVMGISAIGAAQTYGDPSVAFKNYLNEDDADTFGLISIEVTESSNQPFLVSNPEIVVEFTGEKLDDS